MSQLQVTFRAGTLAQYQALEQKDEGCLYFIIDKNMIFRGTQNVTSRYLISSSPLQQAGEDETITLTDQLTGQSYTIPLYSTISGFLESRLVLHFYEHFIESDADLLAAIDATSGTPGSGTVKAGTVFRVETKPDQVTDERFNPGQFARPDYLVAYNHDLIIALKDIEDGRILNRDSTEQWEKNKDAFAVIPTDLINLVTATGTLDNNTVILGAGQKAVKSLPFAGANKVLRTNSSNNGVEWVSPETVQNVITWEDIDQQA